MRFFGALMLAILFVGCMHPTQAVMTDVDPYRWEQTAKIEMENGDTSTLRDITLVLRTNRHFRADSLALAITLLTPDSCHYDEQVEIAMQHHHTPAALRLISELPYRRRAKFDRMGIYSLLITPLRPMQGIEAVGINIIKSPDTSE